MPKIAFVGAGSAVFTRYLVGDILGLPELRDIRTVGLCHSVQHTAAELAADLGLPAAELDCDDCCGDWAPGLSPAVGAVA